MKKAAKKHKVELSDITTPMLTALDSRIKQYTLRDFGGIKGLKATILSGKPLQTKAQAGPRVLIFDIETAPMLAYVWGLRDQNLGLNMIKNDWHVLSWSAKWLGDPPSEVMYEDTRDQKDISNDKKILKSIWKLLDEADITITQNGKRFDRKKLNARFIMHGMQPPSSYKQIDTLVIARKHFAFTSNKLAYMTDKLCTKYKKLSHGKFSGFSLWAECLKGNKKAWEEMEEYNRYDVLSLEELYHKLIPWDSSINFNLYTENNDVSCKCGETRKKQSGFYYTTTGKYQKHKCVNCGNETRDSINLLSVEKKKTLTKRGDR